MEDILSSIRKIIQSNEEKDGGNSEQQLVQQAVAQTQTEAAAGEQAPQSQNTEVKPEKKLVVSPVEKPGEPAKPASPTQSDVSKSEAAVSASVGAEAHSERGELTDAPARAPQAAVQAPEVASPEEQDPVTPVEAPASTEREMVASTEAAVEAPVSPEPTATSEQKMEPESSPSLAAQVVASAQEAGVEHVVAALEGELNTSTSEDKASPDEPLNNAPALLSTDSGAKVAASFAALEQSLEDVADKNLETMTTEMLRPMLQDWLDDNLPSLVERLVREEIERVARGG
jgi:hypothetical protein